MTKTTRVMLAVLAACGASAAMAQSSVTLYGRVNTTIESQKLGNVSASGMVSNSSYFGMKGVEDLGNGLKAGFILESGFASDTGAGGAPGGGVDFTRQSEVNLGGNFGTLRLGNFDAASLYAISDPVSMHNHDTGTSADVFADNYLGTANKIAYVTPSFGGFTAEVQYQFGEKNLTNRPGYEDKGGWDLAANYANGPLALGLGYSKAKSDNVVITDPDYSKSQFGGYATYSIGNFTLAGYYQKQTSEENLSKSKRDVYRLAAKYEFGASELHANVGRASKEKVNGIATPGSAATQWTLAYNYNLSKRTKVYALYTKINNGLNAGYGYGKFIGGAPTQTGADLRSFGVGIRHLF